MLRRIATVETTHQKVAVWKSPSTCEFRVAGAIHAWWHAWNLLTGLAWDNLAAAALLRPAGPPRSVLMLGLAGGTAMRILRHLLPDARFVAVDIDAGIVELAREHMHLDNLGIEVHLADAYEWCARCKERFDVVIDDIYLAGREDVFRPEGAHGGQIGLLKKLLNPGGLVLANLVNGPGHRKVQMRTRAAFRRAFPVVRSIVTPASMNETLAGGDDVLPRSALKPWSSHFPQPDDRDLWALLRVSRLTELPAKEGKIRPKEA